MRSLSCYVGVGELEGADVTLLVWAALRHRMGRSLAVVAAVVVAAVSFCLLSSAVATSQLRVEGTVQSNYRSAYDILVRPSGSRSPIERSAGLVQENYLSGIYGGISLADWHTIEGLPGVTVAAPIAMVGYLIPFENVTVPLGSLLSGDADQLFRLKVTAVGDDGLSQYAAPSEFAYVNRRPGSLPVNRPGSPCASFYGRLPHPSSAFDLPALAGLTCYTTDPVTKGQGPPRVGVSYDFPVLLAAIDPVQENKLVGLGGAVVSGRYLTAADHTRLEGYTSRGATVPAGSPTATTTYHQVPVMVSDRPLTSGGLTLQVQRLAVPKDLASTDRVEQRLGQPGPVRWLDSLPANTVKTVHLTDRSQYARMLAGYESPVGVNDQYWSVGQVTYQQHRDGSVSPQTVHPAPPETWLDPLNALQLYDAPQASKDVAFRNLHVHFASNRVSTGRLFAAPRLHPVGTFDPTKIEGFSSLSRVPLTTYYPPDATPGDPRSARLLHGRSLLPDHDLAGYLQQPPMLLTTIRSIGSFSDPNAFSGTTASRRAPISVIRVRVAGVTGANALSLARVRLVAAQIIKDTGLDVDITMGSSPHQIQVDLPAGNAGRPPLVLNEGWVKKGVAVALLSAIDTKSLLLFVLVLLVCGLFLVNATVASTRVRATELGVLACLGWPRRRIFQLLEYELIAVGVVAGLLSTGIAAVASELFAVPISWWRIGLVVPISVTVVAVSGLWPAWRACRVTPMRALRPLVRNVRATTQVRTIRRLGLVGLLRSPGRSILGAASLLVGSAALTAMITIQHAFNGQAVGTSLGNVVAVQVRGVDYLAAILTIGLGAFAVADVVYLNISERRAEIASLQASGWAERHVRRLFRTEGLTIAIVGATLGCALATTTAWAILPIHLDQALAASAASIVIAVLASTLALIVPLLQLARLEPATALDQQ